MTHALSLSLLMDLVNRLHYGDGSFFIDSLASLFRGQGISKILDVAGGTGFPIIGLALRGWDVAYSDNSEEMLQSFRQRLQSSGLSIPHRQCRWAELPSCWGDEKFDVVLCRGNSLLYLNTWVNGRPASANEEAFLEALKGMAQVLRPGGFLYVDLAVSVSCGKTEAHPEQEVVLDGQTYVLGWTLSYDEERKVRVWYPRVCMEGQCRKFSLMSAWITPARLMQMLVNVGLGEVQQIAVAGEETFTVFWAQKSII